MTAFWHAIRSKECHLRLYVYVPLPLIAAIGLAPGEKIPPALFTREILEMKRSPVLPTTPKRSPQNPR